MRVDVEVTGIRDAVQSITKNTRMTNAALSDIIEAVTFEVHNRAVTKLMRGPKTGRIYQKYNPRRTHRASRIGEYPATDTGRLAASTRTAFSNLGGKNPEGQVYSNVKYGLHLEMKPSSMGGRPWLTRAAKEILRRELDSIILDVLRAKGFRPKAGA
jgi:hypothetical protein